MDKCIDYFDQAINLEQDPLKKADYAYKTAAILFSKKQLSKAKLLSPTMKQTTLYRIY